MTEFLFVVAPAKVVLLLGFAIIGVVSALQQFHSMAAVALAVFLLAGFHFLRPVVLSVRSGEPHLTLIRRGPTRQIRSDLIREMTYTRSTWQPVGWGQLYLTLNDGKRLPVPGASGAAYLRFSLSLPAPSSSRTFRVCRTRQALSILQDRLSVEIDTSGAALLSPSE